MTALDVSQVMVDLARERLGGRAKLVVADISQPLLFARSCEFDLVVASLVMHYVFDWQAVLCEFRRVLSPQGRVVFLLTIRPWTGSSVLRRTTPP